MNYNTNSVIMVPHQCMERRDGEDPQATEGGFGGTAGNRQQALVVW